MILDWAPLKLLAVLTVAAALIACSAETDRSAAPVDVIRLGVLPDKSVELLENQYRPLLQYLADRTSLRFEFVIPDNYPAMLDAFEAGDLQIANFGGLTFTQAEHRSRAEPLIMRDVDLSFTSCYLVRGSDERRSLSEFGGETFAFGPRLSTSGHLMPRHFMTQAGLDPESFFASVRHSRGHDETAALIRDGTSTIGVANCVIVQSMIREGRLSNGDVRILETTPAYSNYVWAVQESLDDSVKTVIRDAFLDLDASVPEHRTILTALGANGYLPAGRTDFDDIRTAATAISLFNDPGIE